MKQDIVDAFTAEFGKKEDFGQPGAMWEAFLEIYAKGYHMGWNHGYDDGAERNNAHVTDAELRQRGWDEGYEQGYDEGFDAADGRH